MLSLKIISGFLLVLAPAIVIGYSLFRSLGLFSVDSAENLESAWQRALQDEQIDSSEESFQRLYSILTDRMGESPKKEPDHLLTYSGGFGVASEIYCGYGERDSEDHEIEALAPLVLADKWIRDHSKEIQEQRDKKIYFFAILLLFIGYILELIA
jgi:hypothetical protein